MSGFQDLVEGGHYWEVTICRGSKTLMGSEVTICRGSKTWWREGIIDQCGYYMSGFQDLVQEGGHY